MLWAFKRELAALHLAIYKQGIQALWPFNRKYIVRRFINRRYQHQGWNTSPLWRTECPFVSESDIFLFTPCCCSEVEKQPWSIYLLSTEPLLHPTSHDPFWRVSQSALAVRGVCSNLPSGFPVGFIQFVP